MDPEFNRPDDPQDLTPDMIGIEPGMRMIVAENADNDSESMYWDGRGVITQTEMQARVASGQMQYGPSVREELTREREGRTSQPIFDVEPEPPGMEQGGRARESFESLWERYTREFIQKYKLNTDQTSRAWTILHSCQALAQRYLLAHAADLSNLEHRLSENKDEQQTAQTREKLRKEREKQSRRIQDIFERQLKPRLEKLPTGAQREAVERPASDKKP